MKAKIKINYSEVKKGQIFQIKEIKPKRVTLDINGRNVDFGFSEVKIIAQTKIDLFNLGRDFMLMGKTPIQGWREIDVTNFIKQINLPVTKSLMRRAINCVIWG